MMAVCHFWIYSGVLTLLWLSAGPGRLHFYLFYIPDQLGMFPPQQTTVLKAKISILREKAAQILIVCWLAVCRKASIVLNTCLSTRMDLLKVDLHKLPLTLIPRICVPDLSWHEKSRKSLLL